jgi:hypothetical protein
MTGLNPGRRPESTCGLFFFGRSSSTSPRFARHPVLLDGPYLVPSSNGQDDSLSRRESGFDSPWNRHIFTGKRRSACAPTDATLIGGRVLLPGSAREDEPLAGRSVIFPHASA